MGYVTVGSIDDYYKKALAASQSYQDKALADNDSLYNSQKQSVSDIFNKKINDTDTAYEDSYRDNAVQKLINEREVAESMANLGLSDSGLNRTQQTAVQLSYANNRASIDRQKQAQVDSLAQSLAAELATIEQNRLSSAANITNQYSQTAMEQATALRNADIENNAAVYKAEIEAAQKAAEKLESNMLSDKTNLYAHLKDNNSDPDYVAQLIDSYCTKYDIDPTTQLGNTELSALLKAAGLTLSEYQYYVTNDRGTIYSSNKYSTESTDGGRVVGDYKTAGKLNYQIEVVKDTFNGLGGVDRNDVVNIYYPDGSPLKKNVKLKDLTKDVGEVLTKKTKNNQGNKITVSLDLSNEDFRDKQGFFEKFMSGYSYK